MLCIIIVGRKTYHRLLDHTTTHCWCDSHFTNINAYEVWGVRVGIQVFRKEFHTYIHLNYIRVEFLSCIKKKKMKER